MATAVDSPPSHLNPDPDSDHLPLAERRRRLLRPPSLPPRVERSLTAIDRCEANAAAEGAGGAALQSWPGLPRGAQFNPSDSDLVWHLAAEVGNGQAHRHPFIDEFIKSVDEDRGFGCTHPQDIPGVRQDGRASYFFHRRFMLYNNGNDKIISWQKIGAPRSIILDGSLRGCKEVFVLYACKTNDDSPQRTDWRLHQYHIRNAMKDEEELVVSKIFYESQNNKCEWAGKAPAESAQDVSAMVDDSKEEVQVENYSADMATECHVVQDNGNYQEQMRREMYPDQNKLSSCKDVPDTSFNYGNQINNHAETEELDHISLQERYRILLSDKRSCSAMVSSEKCVMNGLENSCRQMHAETSGSIPKSESEEINNEGTSYREDICSMLQEISSAPPIIDSMGDDNNRRLLGEDPSDTQTSQMECFVESNAYHIASSSLGSSIRNSTYDILPCCPDGSANNNNFVVPNGLCQQTHEAGCNSGFLSISGMLSHPAQCLCEVGSCHDPVNTENQGNANTHNFGSELPSSPTPLGNENIQLLTRKSGTLLVDVKLEPTLESYDIYPSESPRAKSYHSSKNGGLEDTGSVPECLPEDSEMDLELLHSKRDLIEKTSAREKVSNSKHVVEGCSLVGSINSVSLENSKRISGAACSQTKSAHPEDPLPSLGVKSELTGTELPGSCENNSNISEPIVKKTRTRSLNHDEGVTYCSRQRKRRKTATDSIEKALEEDAPGLLQILLNRGIMVEEIKLYGVEEDDEVLPDYTESDFQDLENVIRKLFPQRVPLLKFSAARHAKGEKAIYCLSCLISLIEQSRYLQFRDCPVEWGWCRDLQSFIFVFRSHNRIVLERPEYGYATYFFEVVQSLPIEWQLRRLVTAMKLSGCGRTALIENRPLLVGEDLTEGEAQVLEGYGWIPNTGLGTMLSYRDRVVHDRWNEKCSTDWRMKIGKLLMNGYAEGQSIITRIPKKVGKLSEDAEIKLEDSF